MDELEKLRRLFRVKKNELSMMILRGFPLEKVWVARSPFMSTWTEVNLSEFLTFDFNRFLQFRTETGLFQDRAAFSSVYQIPATQNTCMVIYLLSEPGKKVNKENFEVVLKIIQSMRYHHLILISENGLNPERSNYIQHQTAGYRIEEFIDYNFAIDPVKHALAPITIKHVPGNQVAEWARQENLQPTQLPIALAVDPITKRYGAQSGDVFQQTIVGTVVAEEGYNRFVRKVTREKKR
jgi:DNA-directed RNA polymerase subunit H (RpoH/RPB5)